MILFKRLSCFLIVLSVLIIVPAAQASSLRAVASFSIIADMIEQVGGEKVEVSSIIPFGGDPHSWEATPREARNIAAADVLFYNGLGLEMWIDRLIANAARKDLPIVVLSEGMSTIASADFTDHSHPEGDPHFWLDVANAIQYVETIEAKLIKLNSENQSYYQANASAYIDELEELDEWLFEQIESIPKDNRRLITYHDSFGYFAKRYGLEIQGFLVVNPEREPSSREMARLARELSQYDNPVIFTESQISTGTRYVEALAHEVGGEVYTLYSDSLSQDNPTYLDMMYYNGRIITEALK